VEMPIKQKRSAKQGEKCGDPSRASGYRRRPQGTFEGYGIKEKYKRSAKQGGKYKSCFLSLRFEVSSSHQDSKLSWDIERVEMPIKQKRSAKQGEKCGDPSRASGYRRGLRDKGEVQAFCEARTTI
ncbi:MAG: hypothetical protein AB8H47_05495, partial [Bacteroidia bacterium]